MRYEIWFRCIAELQNQVMWVSSRGLVQTNFIWQSLGARRPLQTFLDDAPGKQQQHLVNGFFPNYLGKPVPEGLNERWWGGSGIRWTIRKLFAPRSREITMPTPHHSVLPCDAILARYMLRPCVCLYDPVSACVCLCVCHKSEFDQNGKSQEHVNERQRCKTPELQVWSLACAVCLLSIAAYQLASAKHVLILDCANYYRTLLARQPPAGGTCMPSSSITKCPRWTTLRA